MRKKTLNFPRKWADEQSKIEADPGGEGFD
jgi:hypothetical protein